MKRSTSNNNLDSLSDVELHKKLLQYDLPSVPVTETTRKLLINRLKNHIKNEKFKRKQNIKMSLSNNYDDSQINSYTQMHSPHSFNSYNSSPSFSQPVTTGPHVRPSSRMYAPPPIHASDSTEDLRRNAYMNSDRVSSCSNGSPNNQVSSTQYGMVGRLLSFRDSTLKKTSISGQGAAGHENPKMFHKHFYNKFTNNIKTTHTGVKPFLMRFEIGKGSQQAFISQALVYAFFVFFIVLALIYAFMSPDHSKTIREIGTHSVVCDQAENTNQTTQDCIRRNNLENTLSLTNQLLSVLHDRAKMHHCVNKSSPATISIFEFLTTVNQNSIQDTKRPFLTIFRDMAHLITNNPQWKIGITDNNGDSLSVSDNGEYNTQKTFFVLLKPSLPLSCVFINKMTQFFAIIGTGAVIALLLALCYATFKYLERVRQISAERTEQFVSKIISELLESSRKGIGNSSYIGEEIIVNHLRDTLVPLNERKSLLNSWNAALKLLESNDSRIQFAVKTKNGEEVKTIRWVGGLSEKCNLSDTTCVKQWQSPAFDNRNQIVHPPTPCLKIRHMFDISDVSNPNLKQLIYGAIVEKVGPKCNICDVQLDNQTCCVYVRCATEEDAGLIHNEINGWWFDKKLVSIKFLRLERYLSRFPKSQHVLTNS